MPMTSHPTTNPRPGTAMDPQLLSYYEAIERASADMLAAARAGRWDEVVKLEGACVLLISQLKHAAQEPDETGSGAPEPPTARSLSNEAARVKSRIMQRILVNDAEIRHLAEPWLQDLEGSLAGKRQTLH
jgi:flagellar protein FliT